MSDSEWKDRRHGTPGRRELDSEHHIIVDELPERSQRSARRIQIELALIVTVLLAIFAALMKNAVDIASLQRGMIDHERSDDARTGALTEGVSALSNTDDRILIQLERIMTRQEDHERRLDQMDGRIHE